MTGNAYTTRPNRPVNGAREVLREESSNALNMIELLTRWYRLSMAGRSFDAGECPLDEAQHEVLSFGLEEMSVRSTRLYDMIATLQVAR
jgi:hypothetical protein